MKRANGVSEFTFHDGIMVWKFDHATVEYNIGNEPAYRDAADEFARDAVYNGIKQTLVDSMAKKDATVAEKCNALIARRDQLLTREWVGERKSGGGFTLPLVAVLEHYGWSKATITEKIAGLDRAAKTKLYYADKLAKSRKHVEAERAKSVSGGDAILATME